MLTGSELRWKGIQQFAEEVGLPIRDELVVELNPVPTSGAGLNAIRGLLRNQQPFSAVLADDMTAFGVIRGLHEAGLAVPGDCSVIGFDDIDAAEFYNPLLTTIRQPMLQIGNEAARILIRAVKDRCAKRTPRLAQVSVEPELVIRNSTAPTVFPYRPNA